jgi:hypothetical protein
MLFLISISLAVVHAVVLLLNHAMQYSGAWIDVGIDAVIGVIFFALLYSRVPQPKTSPS